MKQAENHAVSQLSNYCNNRRFVQQLGTAYDRHGIQGTVDVWETHFLRLMHGNNALDASNHLLAGEILATFAHDRGKITGILNAWMGCCCRQSWQETEFNVVASKFALGLLEIFNTLDYWKPDIVTLSLAYTALSDHHAEQANAILQHADTIHPSMEEDGRDKPILGCLDLETMLLYENQDVLVINKPSGISLAQIECFLAAHDIPLSDMNPDGSRGFVHRLDMGTSGCLVLAKNNSMHAKLVSQFFLRQVQKSYVALLCNPPDNRAKSKVWPESGTIHLPIDGRPAKSSFKVLETSALVTMVSVTTQQGRRHQVRIHCSRGLNRPIVLDPLYGGEQIMYSYRSNAMKKARADKKFCLHADHISLPVMGIKVDAPVPHWWNVIMKDATD
jgi:23S rRNA-/tRNA-specific pseudouridylate synthase